MSPTNFLTKILFDQNILFNNKNSPEKDLQLTIFCYIYFKYKFNFKKKYIFFKLKHLLDLNWLWPTWSIAYANYPVSREWDEADWLDPLLQLFGGILHGTIRDKGSGSTHNPSFSLPPATSGLLQVIPTKHFKFIKKLKNRYEF